MSWVVVWKVLEDILYVDVDRSELRCGVEREAEALS